MNSSHRKQFNALTLLAAAALAIPGQLSAQQTQHIRYKLFDVGTFGGPNSSTNASSVIMNHAGTITGTADTLLPDPFPAFCASPCLVTHAFRWHKGVLTDVGSLPGGGGSITVSINSQNQIAGFSQNGLIDPVTGIPEVVAAVWDGSRVIDLGTFGGGFSLATMNNDLQQVVGCASNDIPDPFSTDPRGFFYSIIFGPQQLRAFRWQGKQLQDLGTLGGPDACAAWINERGQIAGASLTNSIVNPATGFPTLDPFLWENGRMFDLGTLGGTIGFATVINNQGQVVGDSGLAGDQTSHPFIWPGEDGKMQDLGTLGGSFGGAEALNDSGEVVGRSLTAGDSALHAFFWKSGLITDLGTVGGFGCSDAHAINSRGQVVGDSFDCAIIPPPPTSDHAFLWENSHMIDLNVFVPPGSALQLTEAKFINDSGIITGAAFLPNGDQHAFVLIPCEAGEEGCIDSADAAISVAPRISATINSSPATSTQARLTPRENLAAWRAQMSHRYHVNGPRMPNN